MRESTKNLLHPMVLGLAAAMVVAAGPCLAPATVSAAAPLTQANDVAPPGEASQGIEIFSDRNIKTVNPIWKDASGVYTWNQSGQYNNGKLFIKVLPDGMVLYDFKAARGSESEATSNTYFFAGILKGNGSTCVKEFTSDGKLVKLTFALKGDSIFVTQDGEMQVDLSGEYRFSKGSKIYATEAGIATLLENLPTAATSLTKFNRPYVLELVEDEESNGDRIRVNAINTTRERVFARFIVYTDLSKVYRISK